MTERLAARMVASAIATGAIGEEEREIYLYAYQLAIEQIVGWAFVVLLAVLFGCLAGAMLFIGCFVALRMYVGGYHAHSYGACFSITAVTFTVFCLIVPYLPAILPAPGVLIAGAGCGLVIVWLAPIADPNKPMEDNDLQHCKTCARLILAFVLLLLVLLCCTGWGRDYMYFPLLSLVLISLSLIASRLSQLRKI